MPQKNILLIFTDQQRSDTISALGNKIIKTPVLDNLVDNGISFTRAYTPCPVCIPARYSLKTGQMPHRTNCVFNGTMPAGRKSFMQILGEHGYQTHGVGKMHFSFEDDGANAMWGYEARDRSEEINYKDDYTEYLVRNGFEHVHDIHGVRSEYYYIPQPSQLPARLHHTAWTVDKSIEFLKNRDYNRPFFLMTSFIKPHPPFESPTPFNKLYRAAEMPLPKRPENQENLLSFWNRFQNRYKYRDQGIDNNLIRTIKAAYYSSISFIDFNLGRLLEYMKENGLWDNTLIVFTSDHGEMLGDYNCFGKRCFLDSAARIPMIMVHPELAKGIKCTKPVSLVDIMPTFLQYAGIKTEENYSGQSLKDIVNGDAQRDIVFGQYHRGEYGTYMAVTEKYKYIYSAPDNKEWLYDLEADIEETRNRADNPMYIHIKRDMKKQIISCFKRDGYLDSIDGDDWKRYPSKSLPEDPDAFLLFQDTDSSIPYIMGYEREICRKTEMFKMDF